jgi:RNA polymerase sigma-70 factor (ECF subfamily)
MRDPLANPEPLIRRVYSYVAYRLGDGPEAEDVTSEIFERALRYRRSYDESRGQPVPWLLGIARRCVDDAHRARAASASGEPADEPAGGDLADDVVRRLGLARAIESLDERDRDLLALRYGADLTAREIGRILGMKTNAVEVALHRTMKRLREDLEEPTEGGRAARPDPAPEVTP